MKKKYLLFIFIPVGIIINILSIILIVISCSYYQIRKEDEYYKTANWNIEKEEFYNEYYPKLEKYIYNSFNSKINIDDFKSDINESHNIYLISIINNKFTIDIKIRFYTSTAYVFKFESIYFYEYEKGFSYNDIVELDNILTDFIDKFLMYEPVNNVISDMYNADKKNNSNFFYYDSLIGNLVLGYNLNNDFRYFSFYYTLLMKNSDTLLDKI